MEEATILYSSLSLIFLLICLNFIFQSKKHPKILPPSPPNSLPIIGHLRLLKPPLHRFFHSLSQKYGSIFSLRVGSRLMVVVSSATLAEECFTRNDVVLANRPETSRGRHLGYNQTVMTGAPYGDHWRNLRRIGAIEVFSSSRLNAFTSVRKDEVRHLVLKLSRQGNNNYAKVDLKSMFRDLTMNNIMRMAAGKRYYGEEMTNEAEAREFKELVAEVFGSGGAANPADFLPIFKLFGFENKDKKLGKRIDRFMQKLVDEHRSYKQQKTASNSMIDHLLSLQESDPQSYTDEIIKGFMMVIILAGTDTSAVTLEWAMANLLNHPELLKKARAEIDSQIGQQNLIDEPDISKLHYLQNIISETLRLYPAIPLLLPHMPSSDCTIGGYDVPGGTTVFINAWALHRDPTVWDDPTTFKPERFENEKRESHKLLPFGLGRRACPGASLAHRLVGLTLATLIQCFDWERIDGKEIDMNEGRGVTLAKAQPLKALCRARPVVQKAFY